MKNWPRMDLDIKYNKETNMYKGIAKTKLPCGVTLMETAELENKTVAMRTAQGRLLMSGKNHLDEHGCGR